MIEGLEQDLCRVVALYKNRLDLLAWNGRESTFSIKDVIRHFLFTKAESCGLTPMPNVNVLQWTLDLVCLRQLRLEQVYFIRAKKEDYRALLLFPRSIERVLIALTERSIPTEQGEFVVVRVGKQLSPDTGEALTIPYAIQCYTEAHKETYGFLPLYPNQQLLGAAARVVGFWMIHGQGLNFKEYMLWAMQRWNVRTGVEASSPHLSDLTERGMIAAFKLEKRRISYDSGWTERGWGSLASPKREAVRDGHEGGNAALDTGMAGNPPDNPA